MNKKNHRTFGYIRKLPSGRYQASYVGPDGKRHYAAKSFKAKQDANAFLSAVDVSISTNVWQVPQKKSVGDDEPAHEVTLRSIYREFIDYRAIRGVPLRESTQDLYWRTLTRTLSSFVDNPMTNITQNQISDWYLDRVTTGKVTTASKGYKLMKSMFAYAVRRGYVSANPCDIPGAQSASTGLEVSTPTPEQVLNIAKNMPDGLAFSVLLQAYGALRFEEWTELRRGDVDIYIFEGVEHMRLNIHRAVVRVQSEFLVGSPKSRMSYRQIEVNSGLIPLMKQHLEEIASDAKDALLFPRPGKATHMPHFVFIKRWEKALKMAGMSPRQFRPHSLRHFGATEMLRQGANFAELKVWLGDSSLQALERYLHPTDRGKELANSMRLDLSEFRSNS